MAMSKEGERRLWCAVNNITPCGKSFNQLMNYINKLLEQ